MFTAPLAEERLTRIVSSYGGVFRRLPVGRAALDPKRRYLVNRIKLEEDWHRFHSEQALTFNFFFR